MDFALDSVIEIGFKFYTRNRYAKVRLCSIRKD